MNNLEPAKPDPVRHWVRYWSDAVLSFFYPEVCQICGQERALPDQGYVGKNCQEKVHLIKPPYCELCGLPFPGEITTSFVCSFCQESKCYFAYARAAAGAEGMLLDLIHRYKYGRALWLEPFLAGLLVQAAVARLREENWDLIVPVPLHPRKESEREFNQAARLARWLGNSLDLPLDTRSLARVVYTPSQTQLSRPERAANMRGAFALRNPHAIKNKRIILLDDVQTTGATTNACSRALLEGGAQEVCVWTVARGLLN